MFESSEIEPIDGLEDLRRVFRESLFKRKHPNFFLKEELKKEFILLYGVKIQIQQKIFKNKQNIKKITFKSLNSN